MDKVKVDDLFRIYENVDKLIADETIQVSSVRAAPAGNTKFLNIRSSIPRLNANGQPMFSRKTSAPMHKHREIVLRIAFDKRTKSPIIIKPGLAMASRFNAATAAYERKSWGVVQSKNNFIAPYSLSMSVNPQTSLEFHQEMSKMKEFITKLVAKATDTPIATITTADFFHEGTVSDDFPEPRSFFELLCKNDTILRYSDWQSPKSIEDLGEDAPERVEWYSSVRAVTIIPHTVALNLDSKTGLAKLTIKWRLVSAFLRHPNTLRDENGEKMEPRQHFEARTAQERTQAEAMLRGSLLALDQGMEDASDEEEEELPVPGIAVVSLPDPEALVKAATKGKKRVRTPRPAEVEEEEESEDEPAPAKSKSPPSLQAGLQAAKKKTAAVPKAKKQRTTVVTHSELEPHALAASKKAVAKKKKKPAEVEAPNDYELDDEEYYAMLDDPVLGEQE